ncbi:MAG: hypothetical protein ABW046_22545 [Actinoplanes sp.]
MSSPNAFDPSTWGDEQHERNESLYEPGGPLAPEPLGDASDADDSPVLVSDADALIAERDELRSARDGAQRKLAKLRGFVDAGETELGRLTFRLEAVERELAGGEPDGLDR